MGKIFHIVDEYDERGGYGQRGYGQRGYGQREEDEEKLLEKAFKEGCEHGYSKAMREMEGFDERRGGRGRANYREGFEEKIEKLKEKYK